MSKNMSKKQQELDGFERDTIPELDKHCAVVCRAEVVKKRATDKLKQGKANLDAKMLELLEEGKLEATSDTERNEHVYLFVDGEVIRECFIRDTKEVGFRTHKQPKAEGPELTVHEGGASID